ncbi:hypothetical protein RFF05_03780 [Bengtsoniella intestinalis]|uniref:hypothetical protein n=1 Tax=Bengtsoniella intestinalis TaxID=3073143 RepID=UPI00391FAB35
MSAENTKEAAICEFCGSDFIVEKAINDYNATINISNNISDSTVNIYKGNSDDFIICAGMLERYTGAATEVVIPNSVTSIGNDAFRGCRGLTSITSITSSLSYGEFKGTPWYEKREKREDKKRNKRRCYLTTACMKHQAGTFDDNCHELTILRGFRDTYLKANYPDDIETYYEIAPAIVDAINKLPNTRSKWADIYQELVVPSVDYIEKDKLEEAYHLYKNYSLMLGKKYLS